MIRQSVAALFLWGSASVAQTAPHRAILISFDGFGEQRFREYGDSATAPHVWEMLRRGVCAESVRPAFPSVTPTGHASIWTGAYANVNGVSASSNAALPIQSTTVLDWTDGYKATSLRAEPIWLTAARQGKRVFSHMATQSPQPPSYAPVDSTTPSLDSARARAVAAVALPNLAAMNIYNELVAPGRVIRTPSEMSWAFGDEGDSLHARVRNDSMVVVQLNRDANRSITVRLHATDTTSPRGRPLARYFSEPLRIDLARGRRTFVFFRLFELSRDHSRMLLYATEARVIQANRPDVALGFDEAVEGGQGNGMGRFMERGELGPRASQGGDGTAEYRYMESVELVTRQFMKGTEWGWRTFHPELETDYIPFPDEELHTFLGFADPKTPNVSPNARRVATRMLERAYELVDIRLEQMERLAASEPNTRLFVTGEHGMRPTWLVFKPNVVLRQAGLLAMDSAGTIDLSRSRAVWTRGAWVTVNRQTRKGGIVPADSVDAVLAHVERALLGARDSAGTQIVTRVFRAGTVEGDSLGLGGPGGGDLYVGLAPGYYWDPTATGAAVAPLNFPQGEHGYPSTERDMHPLLCILGDGPGRRIGEVRSIDVAPTVTAWLGISAPAESRGRVLTP